MEEFDQGVRDLHERVGRLDELLTEHRVVADLSERRAEAAHQTAELMSRKVRMLLAAGLFATVVWTPFTAYFAMWMHERVRNTCHPASVLVDYLEGDQTPELDAAEPWYCGMFPGTAHPHP